MFSYHADWKHMLFVFNFFMDFRFKGEKCQLGVRKPRQTRTDYVTYFRDHSPCDQVLIDDDKKCP